MSASKTNEKTARDQGVPAEYLSEKGSFRPGLDARYKSDLVSSALGLDDSKRLVTYEPKDAEKRLAQRGWTKFLRERRKRLEAKS